MKNKTASTHMPSKKVLDVLNGFSDKERSDLLGDHTQQVLLQKILLDIGSTISKTKKLSLKMLRGLTLSELLITIGFFSAIWEGDEDILEIGPHLGSSTWAIAQGILENTNLQSNTRIYTFDKFKDYAIPDKLMRTMDIPKEIINRYIKSKDFKEIFDFFHSNEVYADRIIAEKSSLPDTLEQIDELNDLFSFPKDKKLSAVFVDGCKSWHGTKYFFMEIIEQLSSGAHIICQDYAHYTCFWVPVFFELFKDHFQLITYVDNTYIFKYIKPLPRQHIIDTYPNTPKDFSLSTIIDIFTNLILDSHIRKDSYGYFKQHLQLCAIFAYIEEIDYAKNTMRAIKNSIPFQFYIHEINAAEKSITYYPCGKSINISN